MVLKGYLCLVDSRITYTQITCWVFLSFVLPQSHVILQHLWHNDIFCPKIYQFDILQWCIYAWTELHSFWWQSLCNWSEREFMQEIILSNVIEDKIKQNFATWWRKPPASIAFGWSVLSLMSWRVARRESYIPYRALTALYLHDYLVSDFWSCKSCLVGCKSCYMLIK